MAIAVTNEAGWGLVSTYRSGRVFTELLGEVNQEMAAASDEVIGHAGASPCFSEAALAAAASLTRKAMAQALGPWALEYSSA